MARRLFLDFLLFSGGVVEAAHAHEVRRRDDGSSGCGSAPARVAVGTRTHATLNGGREYMYWLPPSYEPDEPTPLILSFHGGGRTPDWQANLDQLTDPVFNTDHILVYPSSEDFGPDGEGGRNRFWQGAPDIPADRVVDIDDVGYVMDILDSMESKFCIDRSRVYATGKSQGGMMTNNLACDADASVRIAAFAPVSGSYYIPSPGGGCSPAVVAIPCEPARCNVPILAFHGGNDTTIPYRGGLRKGDCLPSITHWIEEWAGRDGLATEGDSTDTTDLTSDAKKYLFGVGQGKRDGLVSLIYDGDRVNHDWPATVANTDNLDHGSGPSSFNASSLIVEFFGGYTLPNDDGCEQPPPEETEGTTACFASCTDFGSSSTSQSLTIQTSTSVDATTTTDSTATSAPAPSTTDDTPPTSGADRVRWVGNVPSGVVVGLATAFYWICA